MRESRSTVELGCLAGMGSAERSSGQLSFGEGSRRAVVNELARDFELPTVVRRLPDRHIPNSGVHRQHISGFDVIEQLDRTGEMLQQAEARAAMLGIVPPYLRSDFRTHGDSSDSIDLPPLAAS